jgi:hypothetical protein
MDLKETKESLNKFAKYVVQQSRSNLTKNKKNYSKELYNSLGSEIDVSANSFSLDFVMEKYGIFQDRGVRGTESGRSLDGFRFRNKMPPIKPIAEWAKFKNIRLRNKKGQFAKGDYKTIGYIISRNIYKKGIKPSLFFTKPFEKAFKNLPNELVEAYGLDVEQFLQYTIKDNGK